MTRLRRRTLSMAVAGGATTLALLAAATPAAAQPATTVSYPAWSSATRYVGRRLRHLHRTSAGLTPGLERLAVPGRRGLRRRGQPDLRPAGAHPDVDGSGRRARMVAAAGLQGPAAAVRRQGHRPEDHPGPGRQRGHGGGGRRGRPGQGAGHAARQRLLQRHRELLGHGRGLPDRRAHATCPAGRGNCTGSATSPASTRTSAQGPRTCPGSTRRPPTPARTPCGSPGTTGTRRWPAGPGSPTSSGPPISGPSSTSAAMTRCTAA